MGTIIKETERLLIREFELSDAPAVLEFNNDPRVTRYTGDAGMCESLADAENIINDIWLAEYARYGYARWAVVLKSTGKVIGFSGFKNDSRIKETDIGYRFAPEHWGKGYATESNLACIEYAKQHMQLEYVVGEVVVENEASINVLLKLGMVFNKQYRDMGFTLNRYDMHL